MSNNTSNNNENLPKIESLHHPEVAAVVNDQKEDKSAGQRALLAQKLKSTNTSFVSPTDNLMTPVTAKLANHKKKNFSKAKPMQLADRFQSTLPTNDSTTQSNDSNKDSNPFNDNDQFKGK